MNWEKHFSKLPYIGKIVTNQEETYEIIKLGDNDNIDVKLCSSGIVYTDINIYAFKEFKDKKWNPNVNNANIG